MQSKFKENEQKYLFIKNSGKFGRFWVNPAASRPKDSICAPAACAWRATARERKIVPNEAYHHRKIQKKCHSICQNHSLDIFEREIIWGWQKLSRNCIVGLRGPFERFRINKVLPGGVYVPSAGTVGSRRSHLTPAVTPGQAIWRLSISLCPSLRVHVLGLSEHPSTLFGTCTKVAQSLRFWHKAIHSSLVSTLSNSTRLVKAQNIWWFQYRNPLDESQIPNPASEMKNF